MCVTSSQDFKWKNIESFALLSILLKKSSNASSIQTWLNSVWHAWGSKTLINTLFVLVLCRFTANQRVKNAYQSEQEDASGISSGLLWGRLTS